MDILQGAVGVFVVIGFAVLVLLIGREIVCWYWKVNASLEQLGRVVSVLQNIDQNLTHLSNNVVRATDQRDD